MALQIETPGQRVFRQWFQGKLAERMIAAGLMARKTDMLLRGALKQQDGTLGQPGEPTGADDMQISVGDTYVMGGDTAEAPAAPTAATPSLLSKALPYVLAAVLGGGGVVGGLSVAGLRGGDKPAVEDRDTTRIIDMGKFIPE